METQHKVYRAHNLASERIRIRDRLRLAKETAARLLDEPADSFLGRRSPETASRQEAE